MADKKVNIVVDSEIRKGFTLPEGSTWDKKTYNGMIEGKTTVRNKNSVVTEKLKYENGKLNGECLFYKNGCLKEKVTYVNDVAEGWSCECNMGKEVKWYIYERGKKKCELLPCEEKPGYWRETIIGTKNLISICQYDEKHLKTDIGYLYDKNKINQVVLFSNDEMSKVSKEFKNKTMIEYDDNDCIKYEGGFTDSLELDYPRNGEGYEMKEGKCIYIGSWKNGKKNGYGVFLRNGEALYEGNWLDDIPHGKGVLYNDKSEALYNGEWKKGCFDINENEYYDFCSEKVCSKEPTEVKISSGTELKELLNDEDRRNSVNILEINENCGNELSDDLKICGLQQLKSIVVNKNSLRSLNSLIISENPLLETIDIKDGGSTSNSAFYSVKNIEFSNLPSLKTLYVGTYSFYCRCTFIIDNLPQLTEFKTGAYSFYDTASLVLTKLPELIDINFGSYSFYQSRSCVLSYLPKLTTLYVSDYSFYNCNSLTMSNLTQLNSFNNRNYSYYACNYLSVTNVPFTNGSYSYYSSSTTFGCLRRSYVTADGVSNNLRTPIYNHLQG